MFLCPFSSEMLGIGLLPNIVNEENYIKDFFRIASIEVLIIGIVFIIVAMILLTYLEEPT